MTLQHKGELSASDLSAHLGLKVDTVAAALEALIAEERVQEVSPVKEPTGHEPRYRAAECVIGYGDEQGWEAALFDHYQAMVTAIVAKVRSGQTSARRDELAGGSTYHFDLYPGHPREQEVLGLLAEIRDRVSKLRSSVEASPPTEAAEAYRVVLYAGQHVIQPNEDVVEADS